MRDRFLGIPAAEVELAKSLAAKTHQKIADRVVGGADYADTCVSVMQSRRREWASQYKPEMVALALSIARDEPAIRRLSGRSAPPGASHSGGSGDG
jgi:hypothetical protein